MIKINISLAAVLLAAAIVVSATAVLAKETEVNKIEFNLEGLYQTYDPVTKTWTSVPASAVFDGNIRTQGDNNYLSPLSGIINIDGVDNNIQIKDVKQSEPMAYIVDEYGIPGDYYYKIEQWMGLTEVNIQGHKFIGQVGWYNWYEYYYGMESEGQESILYLSGVVDGKPASAMLWSDSLPVIS